MSGAKLHRRLEVLQSKHSILIHLACYRHTIILYYPKQPQNYNKDEGPKALTSKPIRSHVNQALMGRNRSKERKEAISSKQRIFCRIHHNLVCTSTADCKTDLHKSKQKYKYELTTAFYNSKHIKYDQAKI